CRVAAAGSGNGPGRGRRHRLRPRRRRGRGRRTAGKAGRRRAGGRSRRRGRGHQGGRRRPVHRDRHRRPRRRRRTAEDRHRRAATAERIDEVKLWRRPMAQPAAAAAVSANIPIGVSGIAAVTGSRKVANADLRGNWQTRSADDIVKLTGIESRRWAAPGETVFSLAVAAARRLLTDQRLELADIDLVIAATGTPDVITPSLACRVADALADNGRQRLPAYDINAACSGYLYALAQARDFIAASPASRV